MEQWVPVVVALITGVFSAPVWNFMARKLGWEQTRIDRLQGEIDSVKGQHKECEQDLRELSDRLVIVEHHHSSAFARWISDAKRRIVWMNARAMVSIFGPLGLTRDEIEGKTWHDIIDNAAADELDRLSLAALAHDGSAVSGLIRLHPDLPVHHVVKIATDGRDGDLIFEAIAFRMNDPDIVIGLGIARTARQRAASIDHLVDRKGKPDK